MTFTLPGTYVLRLSGSDSLLSAHDEVTLQANFSNQAPKVDAGPDQSVTAPTLLHGKVVDDGLPSTGSLTVHWTQVAGPGLARFDNVDAASCGVSFSQPGTYILRLSATDSEASSEDDVTINVGADPYGTRVYTLDADFDLGKT
ncbi:MAG: hypothetical protein V4710_13175, partial [Verrucomicrobiota bacterium]